MMVGTLLFKEIPTRYNLIYIVRVFVLYIITCRILFKGDSMLKRFFLSGSVFDLCIMRSPILHASIHVRFYVEKGDALHSRQMPALNK